MAVPKKEIKHLLIKFNNVYQELEADKEISRRRTAAVDYVLDYLRGIAQQQIRDAGIIPDLEQSFLQQEPVATTRVILLVESKFSLSGMTCKSFRNRAEIEPAAAMQYLRDVLLDKLKIAAYKNKPLSAAVWHNFINIRRRTSEQNLLRIAESVGLNASQTRELLLLRIPDTFTGVNLLWDDMNEYRKRNPMSWTNFYDENHISKDTWYKFRFPDTVVSQSTLLKLTIALLLTEPEAQGFMKTVGSGFITLQDLFVLACIRCGQTDPDFYKPSSIYELMDYYAEKYPYKSYPNIYHQSRKDFGIVE